MLYHGRPGTDYDATFWQALHALQDRMWPQMSARIEAARKLGVHWEAETTPFAWVEEERALAHVGVIAHPLRLLGEDRWWPASTRCASTPRRADAGWHGGAWRRPSPGSTSGSIWPSSRPLSPPFTPMGLLGSTNPPVRRSARRRWRSGAPRGVGRHSAHPRAALRAHAPLRRLCHPRARLAADYRPRTAGSPAGGVLVVPQRDFLIVARQQGEVLHLDDVVGPELPGLEEVLAAIPFRFERVIYGFTPDRLDPGARPEVGPSRGGGDAGPRRLAGAAALCRVLGLGTLSVRFGCHSSWPPQKGL